MIRPNEYELTYKGKESEESILTNTPMALLKEVKTFGSFGKLVWGNMLIFGDNLPVLKALKQLRGVRNEQNSP